MIMASLHFRYGSMNSGKSLDLYRVSKNYTLNGNRVLIIKPKIDTKSPRVVSRTGLEIEVDKHAAAGEDLYAYVALEHGSSPVSCVLVDEAQFLDPRQVEELLHVAVRLGVPVMCFGLRSDSNCNLFPASARLFALAERIEEVRTVCSCGKRSNFNARKNAATGEYIRGGAQVAIDDGTAYEFEPLCAACYDARVGLP